MHPRAAARGPRPRPWASLASWTAVLALLTSATPAAGQDTPASTPVAFGADHVGLDPSARALEASGHVHVDEPPFHLMSDSLILRRVPLGAQLEGEGRVAFCPCLGTPVAVRFKGATVAPPHDLILRQPVLEVFGVPVAWAPAIWLRSPGRVGLLPPDIAWRGADGLFLGGGVHAPWIPGDVQRGIDLRAGGYLAGGVAVQGQMRTGVSDTGITWDRWRGDDGIGLTARGATAMGGALGATPAIGVPSAISVGWTVDGLRGPRAVRATTDLDAAARPFDRAEAQAAVRGEGGERDQAWMFASGVRAAAVRGADALDLAAGGPVVTLRRADGLGRLGAYDATLEAGAVLRPARAATSFARAEGGALLARSFGPIETSLALRARGDADDDGSRPGVAGSGQARLRAAVPLARAYGSPDEDDPWVHVTEPAVEVALLGAHASDGFALPSGRAGPSPSGRGGVFMASWSNALGRRGSRAAVDIDAAGGAVGGDRQAQPAVRARAATNGAWLALSADWARVLAPVATGGGGALLGRARLGPASALHLTVSVAERDGVDPLLARALVDASLEPSGGFLAASGWTGGARIGLPLGSRVTVRSGADLDLDARQLVAATGALELHDPCQCVVFRASAAHRVGRDGFDAWLSVDVQPP